MAEWMSVMGIIVIMIVVLGIFAAIQMKKQMAIRKQHPGTPKGYWMGQGIAIGMPIGICVGVAMGNIGIGAAIGVAIGTAIGSGLEKKHKDEIRPLTDEEQKLRTQSIMMCSATLLVGVVVFVITYFVSK